MTLGDSAFEITVLPGPAEQQNVSRRILTRVQREVS